jgi:hypothetical protein
VNTEYNPYAPPRAPVGAEPSSSRLKPRTVAWSVAALWVAYGITFAHAVIVIGDRWLSWPPEFVALNQIVFEVVCAVLIYFVSRGRYWARLIYGVYLGVRTVHVIQHAPADWRDSHGLVLMTVVSFTCQYVAMYWLLTEPGRRWFSRSRGVGTGTNA